MSVTLARRVWVLAVVLGLAVAAATFLSIEDDEGVREDHGFHEIVRIAGERTPRSEGARFGPDENAMILHQDVVYVAYSTDAALHVTATGLDGRTRWARRIDIAGSAGSVRLVTTPAKLVVVIDQRLVGLDSSSGNIEWTAEGDPTHVVGGLLLTRRDSAGMVNAYDPARFGKMWSVPATKTDTVEVGDQYLVLVDRATGVLRALNAVTGVVRAEAGLGAVNSVVAVGDTIYVHDNESGTVTAYAAADLATVRWRASVPPTDGADMWACGEQTLCVSLRVESGGQSHIALDAGAGRQLWRSDTPFADVHLAGGYLVMEFSGTWTDIVDVRTGEVRERLGASFVAHVGDGVVIANDLGDLIAYDARRDRTVSLGPVPAPTVREGDCEWHRSVVLCAGETEYVVFRYQDTP